MEPDARFLDALAAGTAEPGGGAATAMAAALGAALVAMVSRLSGHPTSEADDLRAQALALAAEDAEAYRAVVASSGPARRAALERATDVPVRTAALAAQVIGLGAELAEVARHSALADLGVGLLCARAALDGAVLNAEVNLALIGDEGRTAEVRDRLGDSLDAVPLVDRVLAQARGGH